MRRILILIALLRGVWLDSNRMIRLEEVIKFSYISLEFLSTRLVWGIFKCLLLEICISMDVYLICAHHPTQREYCGLGIVPSENFWIAIHDFRYTYHIWLYFYTYFILWTCTYIMNNIILIYRKAINKLEKKLYLSCFN